MPADLVHTPPESPVPGCPLCHQAGGTLVWQDADWRVIRAEEPDFPAFYRLVLRRHVAEWSDLDDAARARGQALLLAVERLLRARLAPTKINLAALGNVVPHLHWHVVARFEWDSHFPDPVWAPRRRTLPSPAVDRLACTLDELDAAVAAAAERT